MGDLIDTWLPWLSWVTLADREQQKRWSRCLRIDDKDSSPTTVWLRDVVLGATAELSPVASFGFARTK